MALIRQVKDDGPILKDLLDKIESFRASVRKLSLYDWVPIPLVYTQVVFLVVRCYFLAALIGRQYIEPSGDRKKALDFRGPIDFYFPILTVVEFIFYVGWMKVAEALLNPFGNDDDDFEVNYMIDRNLQVGLTIVDDAIAKIPPIVKDKFWGQTAPELLYTEETASRPDYPLVGSATEIDV
uniref:Bestrophin homolog n=1 Tax=Plectus sambesii TaxID=2011161 RepID=A0A914UIN0_9BILA